MSIEITFKGDFVINNKVSMRTMAQTYTGIQKALERSYIDIHRKGISKGEKINDEEREATEFYLESYQKGSFISIFKAITPNLKKTIDKLGSTLINPYDNAMKNDGYSEHERIIKEAQDRNIKTENEIIDYESAMKKTKIYVPKNYGSKSILNHFDSSLIPVRTNRGENTIEIYLQGNENYRYKFNRETAINFKKVISEKSLGDEFIFEGHIIKLNSKNKKGTIKHISNNQEATIVFTTDSDYNIATKYLVTHENGKPSKTIRFIGITVNELKKTNLKSGDIIFKKLLENKNV